MMPVRSIGKRYLAISVEGEDSYSEQEVSYTLYQAVKGLFGDFGVSLLQPRLVEYNEETSIGIIRCRRSHMWEMRAVLALITEISNQEVAVRVMGASGTIKSLKLSI
ncbi:hypothetical protein CL673_02270 [Candidatus Bathyarchaeota archaeon]|jgi:RNase P/RNase MRP subunit POP5|nr:hypothetical protein [Candidatus Bathyarchaeota archaeon]MDP6048141.1 Rpp14/Pop5 family protein [Candidatus Bathyarchaeota archaeon]MDP7443546.1 Rpp14/Pop5 family protein [Candidatus Bathyarchaeota archaeon]|tara:strand:+ start:297 stop:617 length:321 start_codon:yes stop_codon:yes gene_type:complete